jgi:1-acyl-sn-glycerol-3-phosphate acyltransferase
MLAVLRIAAIVALVAMATMAMAPAQLAAIRFLPRRAARLPLAWHRWATRLIGVRVRVNGLPSPLRPLLLVANHLSWSDILVLGSVMPLSFVAKSEVARWPAIGWLARLQRTIYVERTRRQASGRQAEAIGARLAAGEAIVLFAEGTTGTGHRVMPFKSALLGAARAAASAGEAVYIQPVAIAYTRLHGLPLGRYHQARAAWPGTIDLGRHLVSFLRDGAYDVEVTFGTAEPLDAAGDRKAAATRMHAAVRAAHAASMRMRSQAP